MDAGGAEIAVGDCFDRIPGHLDPGTEAAASGTREDFETRAGESDAELTRNQDKLLGMDNPEGHSLLGQLRYQFGWRTLDRSKGIETRYETFLVDGCEGTRWIYKPKTRKEDRPCLIYIHGGGFFGGDTLSVENQCKRFAELADAVVISITRDGELIVPRGNTQILVNDKVVVLAKNTAFHERAQSWNLADVK